MNHLNYSIKITLIVFFFFCYWIGATAQSPTQTIDSLKLTLENTEEDTSKMNVLKDLIDLTINADIESSKSYAYQHLNIAESTSNTYQIIESYNTLGRLFVRLEHFDSLDIVTEKALDILSQQNYEGVAVQKGKVYNQLGSASYGRGHYKKALEYYKKASSLFTNEEHIAVIQFNIGNISHEIGEYDKALTAYSLFRESAIKTNNKRNESIALHNIGGVYGDLEEYEKAIDYFRKSQDISEEIGDDFGILQALESIVIIYLEIDLEQGVILGEALFEKSKKLNYELTILRSLYYLISANIKLRNFEKASIFLDDCRALVKDYPDGNQYKKEYLANSALFFNLKGEHSKALKFSEKIIDNFKSSDDIDIDFFIPILKEHAKALFFTGNIKEGWEATIYRDSLVNERNLSTQKEKTAAAEVKLRLREKELGFEKTEQESKLQVAKAEGRQKLFLSLLGGAGLLLLLGFFFYRRIQTAKKELGNQKTLVDQSLLEKEVLLKEIHHRVKNNLQIISNLMAKQARKTSNDTVKKMMQEGQDRVQSMALIHQNLYQSDTLTGINIKAYLEELSQNIARTQAVVGKKVDIQLDVDDSKLDIDTAIPIGLILNELITNSFKYAFPERVTGEIVIGFKQTAENQFLLDVKDNGIGISNDFDMSKARSLGLNLVQGLVLQLDGVMKLEGSAKGTQFELKF